MPVAHGYTKDTQLHEHGTNNKNENHKNLADQIAWVFIFCEVYIYTQQGEKFSVLSYKQSSLNDLSVG